MKGPAISTAIIFTFFACSTAYDISGIEAYPGRSLLHDDHGGNKGDYGCQCKHANWWCHGYCNIGTTSGDVSGCMHDCLVCCGWGQASPSNPPPAQTPMATPAPVPQATDAAAAPAAPAADSATNTPAAPVPPAGGAGAGGGTGGGLTKSATPTPVRVINTGRRLQQKSSGSPMSPSGGDWKGDWKSSSSPPSSPSGDWHGDGHKDQGKKPDPNQCWNSFWGKYPWKTSR